MTLWISWSSLRTHEDCHQKSYQRRQGRKAPMADQRVFFPGTVTDRVVRDWLDNEPEKNLGGMPAMVSTIMDRERTLITDEGGTMKWKSADDRNQVEKDCIEAVTKIEPALLKYVLPYEYQTDLRFKAPLELPHPQGGTSPVILNGALDILVRDNKGRYWVWDVKHTKDSGYWRKTSGQLSFYSWAIFFAYGSFPVAQGLFQPLCKERVKPVSVGDDERKQMMQRIAGMARDVWTDEKTPTQKDPYQCNFCEVKHACEKFKTTTLNGKHTVSLY